MNSREISPSGACLPIPEDRTVIAAIVLVVLVVLIARGADPRQAVGVTGLAAWGTADLLRVLGDLTVRTRRG